MGDEDVRGPGGQFGGGGLSDDEPTLETGASFADEDPTVDIAAAILGGDPVEDPWDRTLETSFGTVTPRTPKRGSRLEWMTALRKERRRRLRNRFWLASAPVLILLVAAVALLTVYGGQGAGSEVQTTTVVARVAEEGSALLLIETDESLSTVVMLQPWGGGGVVLGVPGITLLEVRGVFSTLAETYQADGSEGVKAALSRAFDLPLGPAAVVDRRDLQAALVSGGIEELPEEAADSAQSEAEAAAEAVRSLVSDYAVDGSGTWDESGLGGDTSGFLRAIRLDAEAMAEDVWTAGALAGNLVEGDGFVYLEPDLEAARSLLVVEAEAVVVSVEIRDGAGVDGAARSAGDLLQAAGFILAPMSYAQAYPGVESTQILVSQGDMETGREVAATLGIGEVAEDEEVASDRVVVILGSDFGLESSPSSSDTE